jgi:hypothetical protein
LCLCGIFKRRGYEWGIHRRRTQATKDPVTPRCGQSNEKARTSGFPNTVRGRSRVIPSYEDFLAFPLQVLGRRGGRRLGPGGGERVQELRSLVHPQTKVGLSEVRVLPVTRARGPHYFLGAVPRCNDVRGGSWASLLGVGRGQGKLLRLGQGRVGTPAPVFAHVPTPVRLADRDRLAIQTVPRFPLGRTLRRA